MTAAIAPAVLPPTLLPGPQAEARKRRREILASQRSQTMTASPELEITTTAHHNISTACPILPELEMDPSNKRQKFDDGNSRKTGKKPQMKYDPDVPMTKEEATAWRREQRRKRNRESAAASRQRQRDRINELEDEVESWKTKYESTMAAIAKLEEQQADGVSAAEDLVSTLLPSLPSCSKFVSPPSSPGHSPSYDVSEPVSPIASSSLISTIPPHIVSPKEETSSAVPTTAVRVESLPCEASNNLISRPAVKITEAPPPTFPLLTTSVNDDSSCFLPPDTCLSAPTDVRLEPAIEDTLPPLKQQRLPNLLSDEENEDELGEFLLDAVQWL